MRQLFLASLLVAGLMTGPAVANNFTDGQRLYGLGDFRGAFSSWWPLADKGDARAQFGLALLYEKGNFVELDLGLAKHWAKRAAKQDYQPALTWLKKTGTPKPMKQTARVSPNTTPAPATTAPATEAPSEPAPAVPPRRVVEDPDTAPNESERLRRLIIRELERANDKSNNGQVYYDDVEVKETGPGSYRFSVGNIVLQRRTGNEINLGTVTGQVKDRDKRFRDISIKLPAEINVVNNRGKPGVIRLGKHDIRLTWDNSLEAIPIFDIDVREIAASEQGAQGPDLKIGRLQARSQLRQGDEHWSGPANLSISDVTIKTDTGSSITLAGVALKIKFSEFDLARVIKEQRSKSTRVSAGNGLNNLAGLIAQLDIAIDVERFAASLPDQGQFNLANAHYGANFSNLDKENFDLRIDFGHQGLIGTGTQAPSELVPEQVRLLVDFERLPFDTIARVGLAAGLQAFLLGGIQDGERIVKELSQAAVAANFALTVREAYFKAPILAGKMAGDFKADAKAVHGVMGGLKTQIDGLAAAMQHLRTKPRTDPAKPQTSPAMMPLAMLFAMGAPSKDGKSHNFDLELRADGNLLLNGKPKTAGPSKRAPKRVN